MLRTPICVRWVRNEGETSNLELVVGRHRLAAAIKLNWAIIDCIVLKDDDIGYRLWEIAENLHRADLSDLERKEHLAEWIRLWEEREKKEAAEKKEGEVSGQVDRKPPPHRKGAGRGVGSGAGGGRPEGGLSAATRELHIDRSEARRAQIIAKLTPEAKAEARLLKLDNTQTALLTAARKEGAEAQIAALRKWEDDKAAKAEAQKLSRERKAAAARSDAQAAGSADLLASHEHSGGGEAPSAGPAGADRRETTAPPGAAAPSRNPALDEADRCVPADDRRMTNGDYRVLEAERLAADAELDDLRAFVRGHFSPEDCVRVAEMSILAGAQDVSIEAFFRITADWDPPTEA